MREFKYFSRDEYVLGDRKNNYKNQADPFRYSFFQLLSVNNKRTTFALRIAVKQ